MKDFIMRIIGLNFTKSSKLSGRKQIKVADERQVIAKMIKFAV